MSKRTNKDPSTERALAKLGKRFRHHRESLRISFEKASRVSGLSPGTIRRIEEGDSGVSLGVLVSYLNSLGVGSLFLESLAGMLEKVEVPTDGDEAFAQAIQGIRLKMQSDRM